MSYSYGGEIATAVQTALNADTETKASGTLGVDIRAIVARDPDGGWGILPGGSSHDRQLMVCVEGAGMSRLAAQTLGLEYVVTVVAYTVEHNLLNSATRNSYLRDSALRVIREMHGSTTFMATSGAQILIDDVQHGEPGSYQEYPLAQISESTVRITVIHSD